MLQFSDLTIEATVANCSVEISPRNNFKSGASLKSHKGNSFLVISVLVAVMFSMAACSGGSGGSGNGSSSGGGSGSNSKRLNGTYFHDGTSMLFYTFSGNKYELLGQEGESKVTFEKGTYELVEEYKEKSISRGVINFTNRGIVEIKRNYTLEKNMLTLDGWTGKWIKE